jgi:hypothetical protein
VIIVEIILLRFLVRGGINMTVGVQVKQTVAGLKSAQASLETFALQTENQEAKKIYGEAAQKISNVVSSLEPRVAQLENEEPQYRGY